MNNKYILITLTKNNSTLLRKINKHFTTIKDIIAVRLESKSKLAKSGEAVCYNLSKENFLIDIKPIELNDDLFISHLIKDGKKKKYPDKEKQIFCIVQLSSFDFFPIPSNLSPLHSSDTFPALQNSFKKTQNYYYFPIILDGTTSFKIQNLDPQAIIKPRLTPADLIESNTINPILEQITRLTIRDNFIERCKKGEESVLDIFQIKFSYITKFTAVLCGVITLMLLKEGPASANYKFLANFSNTICWIIVLSYSYIIIKSLTLREKIAERTINTFFSTNFITQDTIENNISYRLKGYIKLHNNQLRNSTLSRLSTLVSNRLKIIGALIAITSLFAQAI